MVDSVSLEDERFTRPPWETDGIADRDLVERQYRELRLVGVIASSLNRADAASAWTVAGGFADLDTGEPLRAERIMLAGSATKLLTATLALRLVAEGLMGLDQSANHLLSSVRLASDAVTVRHLLTHTGGVSSQFEHFVVEVPPLREVLGDQVAVEFEPGGRHQYSNGGYAVLGQLIADVRGCRYPDVVERELFQPLGMSDSRIMTGWPVGAPQGYAIRDGAAVPAERKVPSVPPAGGLCCTVSDLDSFLAGWTTLLPADLVLAAVSPQVVVPGGGWQGFGWRGFDDDGQRIVGHGGGVLGFRSSIKWDTVTDRASVVLINSESDGIEGLGRDLLTDA